MQALDPDGFYTNAEVLTVLRGHTGDRVVTFRFDRLSETNAYLSALGGVLSGSVDYNALADIKRTAKLSMLDTSGFNFLKERVKPWVRLAMPKFSTDDTRRRYVEWPQGVFLTSTPKRKRQTSGLVTREVDCYDQLLVLSDDKVGTRYTVAPATVLTTAISTLITGLGFEFAITPSALTSVAAMEWEPGTAKLRILNDLLAALNYESAWFDENGKLICRPYLSPATRSSEYTFATDEHSLVRGDIEETVDLFKIPNKWILTVSEPDIAAPLVGTYTNANPASPTSTVARGRTILDFRTEQVAADQATLDAKAARLGFEASQVFQIVEFSTMLFPLASNADVYSLGFDDLAIDAKFSEHTWSLPLVAGGSMKHKARRVVTV